MTGAALEHYSAVLREAIGRDSDGQHLIVLVGKVDNIEFTEITVIDDRARVTGRYQGSIVWREPGIPGTTRVEAWEDFEVDLELTPDGWRASHVALFPRG